MPETDRARQAFDFGQRNSARDCDVLDSVEEKCSTVKHSHRIQWHRLGRKTTATSSNNNSNENNNNTTQQQPNVNFFAFFIQTSFNSFIFYLVGFFVHLRGFNIFDLEIRIITILRILCGIKLETFGTAIEFLNHKSDSISFLFR